MIREKLEECLLKEFDCVGIIKYSDYIDCLEKRKLQYEFLDYKSLIIVLKGYKKVLTDDLYKVASYCHNHNDYHKYLKELVLKCDIDFEYDFYVDVSPFYEKIIGVLANIGFIGKNNLLINEKLGSYFNIGIIATKKEFDIYDIFEENKNIKCNECNLCIRACKNNVLDNGFCKEK